LLGFNVFVWLERWSLVQLIDFRWEIAASLVVTYASTDISDVIIIMIDCSAVEMRVVDGINGFAFIKSSFFFHILVIVVQLIESYKSLLVNFFVIIIAYHSLEPSNIRELILKIRSFGSYFFGKIGFFFNR
jgi:hypothetical protein